MAEPRPFSARFSANALQVLRARYLRRDATTQPVETPQELLGRVATAVADGERLLGNAGEAEYWREAFLRLMSTLDFLPNSPTLMNAGTALGQLSACFVLPVEDTMAGIFEAIKQMALIQQTGGGTGFSFSRLRPRGDIVASTGGDAAGPVSFMKVFDCATEHIKQGGKRRGANMGVLRVDHPDILEFVEAKLDGTSLQNFNISVGVTDAYMAAVQQDRSYDLVHPRTGRPVGRVRAAEVFERIANAAWHTGDPGLLFLETINRANPTPHVGAIEATNPCGEVPLLPFESCNLGSLNLAHMVRCDGPRDEVDWERLRATARVVVRFLDDVIEVNRYPLPQVQRATLANRKIGLGVMGFAELLIRLGVSYDSDEAVQLAGQVMKVVTEEAYRASCQLAQERGVFPNWKGSTYESQGVRIRNATRTAVAPTGTISIIANTSSGIEPLFALAYRRSHVLGGQTLYEVNPVFLECIERYGLHQDDLVERILERGNLGRVEGFSSDLARLFVTALEIPPERHLQIEAAFQRYVDNSVSKTINLPPEATPQEVGQTYIRAWELGLKGITIYRYGSKPAQVLELGVGEEPHYYEHGAQCDPGECRL
jgi:ribonucleoside-diphosphate reductase alpha chain